MRVWTWRWINLSTGRNQHYFSLLRASQHFKYTTDGVISAAFTTIIHRQPSTVCQLHLHIFPVLFIKAKAHNGWGYLTLGVCLRACEALMEPFLSAASHLVDTGGSIVPPVRRPGCPEGMWDRNVQNKSPGYRDIRTADSCRQSTGLNPGWCGR